MRVPQRKINVIIGHVCPFETKIFLCKEITLHCLTPHRLLIWNMTRQVMRAQKFEPEVCFYCKYTNAWLHLSLFMCVCMVCETHWYDRSAMSIRVLTVESVTPKLWLSHVLALLNVLQTSPVKESFGLFLQCCIFIFCDLHRNHNSTAYISVWQ